MSQPAAIRAAFAEWRMVKSRKVLQLVFEVPLETQGEVLTMLGAPMPDAEIWCGIARLEQSSQRQPTVQRAEAAAERPGVEPSSPTARARASEMGKERYRRSTNGEQARDRAGILASDPQFQAWLPTVDGIGMDKEYTEEEAAQYIRATCCEDQSRGIIATNPEAYRKFLALETMFHQAIGLIPEVRS